MSKTFNDLNVQGFKAAAVAAAIRYSNRLDVGMIISEIPAVAAAVFTTNRVKAAPVLLGRERIQTGVVRGILVNSGNANACTGENGMAVAVSTTAMAAEALNVPVEQVIPSSTGVIGEDLEPAKFERVMPELVGKLSSDGLADVAKAIMTTDTVPKTAVRQLDLGGVAIKIAGIAKGAGMIMPNMATMLCFVVTDIAIDQTSLQQILAESAALSFNAITIDGDTSTNDTLLVMANGAAGNKTIHDITSQDALDFKGVLADLLMDLARQIVKDGEGVTKFVTIAVKGARNNLEADRAARTVANSPLVKTAFFGEDANWGRIIAALGRSGAEFDQGKVEIRFDNVTMVKNGIGQGAEAEKAATLVLKQNEFSVYIDLHDGSGSARIYTNDLSLDYIKINADYRS